MCSVQIIHTQAERVPSDDCRFSLTCHMWATPKEGVGGQALQGCTFFVLYVL